MFNAAPKYMWIEFESSDEGKKYTTMTTPCSGMTHGGMYTTKSLPGVDSMTVLAF